MRHLAAAEHDGHLHLVAVLEEALDMAFLGGVVVRVDLGPQLDLLDGDRRLVLARELGLLLLLVAVLRVVHDAADRRPHLRHADGLVDPCLRLLRPLVDRASWPQDARSVLSTNLSNPSSAPRHAKTGTARHPFNTLRKRSSRCPLNLPSWTGG